MIRVLVILSILGAPAQAETLEDVMLDCVDKLIGMQAGAAEALIVKSPVQTGTVETEQGVAAQVVTPSIPSCVVHGRLPEGATLDWQDGIAALDAVLETLETDRDFRLTDDDTQPESRFVTGCLGGEGMLLVAVQVPHVDGGAKAFGVNILYPSSGDETDEMACAGADRARDGA